jgi:hypothetical protein
MNELRRSERPRRPKKIFEQMATPRKPREPKTPEENAPKPPETRPAAGPVPSAVKELVGQPIPYYSPPIEVEWTPFKIHWMENDPFFLFIKFFGEASIIAIVNATNAKVTGQIGSFPHFRSKMGFFNTRRTLLLARFTYLYCDGSDMPNHLR